MDPLRNGLCFTSLAIPIAPDEVSTGRRRSANFSEAEIMNLVMLYQHFADVFQTRDKRSDAMRRRKEAYDEIAQSLSEKFPSNPRTGKQVAEKVKHLLSELRRFPHVRSPNGSSDPTLPPLKSWQRIIIDIIRETSKYDLESTNQFSYYEFEESESVSSKLADETSSKVRPHTDFNGKSEVIELLDEKSPPQAENCYYGNDLQPVVVSTRNVSSSSRLEDARLELIEMEKQKIEMEKELIAWKIKNAQIKNALMLSKMKEERK